MNLKRRVQKTLLFYWLFVNWVFSGVGEVGSVLLVTAVMIVNVRESVLGRLPSDRPGQKEMGKRSIACEKGVGK